MTPDEMRERLRSIAVTLKVLNANVYGHRTVARWAEEPTSRTQLMNRLGAAEAHLRIMKRT